MPDKDKKPVPAEEKIKQPPAAAAPDTLPDLPPLELPDIPLPPLPELDLSALEKPPEKQPPKRKIEYGSGTKNAGPISFEQMLAHLPPAEMDQPKVSSPAPAGQPPKLTVLSMTETSPPSAAAPAPHLKPAPAVEAVPDVEPERIIEKQPAGESQKPATPKMKIAPPPLAAPVEAPRTTPLVFSQPPQPPLRERFIEFPEEEATPVRSGTRLSVNLEQGYISCDGMDQPIEADLQMALLKLKQFLQQNLPADTAGALSRLVRSHAAAGKPPGELLKLIIVPVLKLGAKRYAILNELLLIKERLPNMEQSVVAALLQKILAG